MASTDADPRRWRILAMGVVAQTASSSFLFGLPYILPELRTAVGGSLATAGLVAACPTIGLMGTLIMWGWLADRWSERYSMTIGLVGAGFAVSLIPLLSSMVAIGALLALAGGLAAAVNAASGRVIMSWFPVAQRGMAMGIRQMAQPFGVALAAATFPSIAQNQGYKAALMVPAVACVVSGFLVWALIIDPPRMSPNVVALAQNPYRHAPIWRVHISSGLLVVAQFALSSFAYLYLVDDRGMAPGLAGALMTATQLIGAAARVAAGRWSDIVGSRLGPLRILAVANVVCMGGLTLAVWADTPLAIPVVVLTAIVTTSGNGLAFTAVAEIAGPVYAGRAMGAQNTVQNVFASATPPILGAVITAAGFATGFGVVIAFPLVATLIIPPDSVIPKPVDRPLA